MVHVSSVGRHSGAKAVTYGDLPRTIELYECRETVRDLGFICSVENYNDRCEYL